MKLKAVLINVRGHLVTFFRILYARVRRGRNMPTSVARPVATQIYVGAAVADAVLPWTLPAPLLGTLVTDTAVVMVTTVAVPLMVCVL
jgi:hypothetical protein